MIWLKVTAAWVHFVMIFFMVFAIAYNWAQLHIGDINHKRLRDMITCDRLYYLFFSILGVAGLTRVFLTEKGFMGFYAHNLFFWCKALSLTLLLLLSFYCSRTLRQWRQNAIQAGVPLDQLSTEELKACTTGIPDAKAQKKLRIILGQETHILALIILFADLMANYVGYIHF